MQRRECKTCGATKLIVKFDPRCNICKACRNKAYRNKLKTQRAIEEARCKKPKGWGFT